MTSTPIAALGVVRAVGLLINARKSLPMEVVATRMMIASPTTVAGGSASNRRD